MSYDSWPFPDSRLSGIKEHYSRIKTFLELASNIDDTATVFRLHIACIYFARGIIELIFEAAKTKQNPISKKDMVNILSEKLRWFTLIERIRIHDFHRFGITPPDPKYNTTFNGGPINLKAKNGYAFYTLLPDGPKIETTGDSIVKVERPLICENGKFFDEEERKYITLEQILKNFLIDVQDVIEYFKDEIIQ